LTQKDSVTKFDVNSEICSNFEINPSNVTQKKTRKVME